MEKKITLTYLKTILQSLNNAYSILEKEFSITNNIIEEQNKFFAIKMELNIKGLITATLNKNSLTQLTSFINGKCISDFLTLLQYDEVVPENSVSKNSNFLVNITSVPLLLDYKRINPDIRFKIENNSVIFTNDIIKEPLLTKFPDTFWTTLPLEFLKTLKKDNSFSIDIKPIDLKTLLITLSFSDKRFKEFSFSYKVFSYET